MSVVIDNIMECITVQLYTNRQNKFIATCVYRTCGPSVETFND